MMAASASAILASRDPIGVPPNPSCAWLLMLCAGRGIHLPPQATVANRMRLSSVYNANVKAGGDYTLKQMLMPSLDQMGEGGGSLRRSLCARVSRFHGAFLLEQRTGDAERKLGAKRLAPQQSPPPAGPSVEPSTKRAAHDVALLALERDRLAFDVARQRENAGLARRRLEFEERQWSAQQASVALAATPAAIPPPLCAPPRPPSVSPPPPGPLSPSPLPPGPPLPVPSQTPLAIPVVVIQPSISGPLLTVLQDIVSLAHADAAARGVFSGLAAIDACMEATPRGSCLRRRLEALRRCHHMYVRMLSWVISVLGDSVGTRLQLPLKPAVCFFSEGQRRLLEAAFFTIDPRKAATSADDGRPFRGATFSTLREALQSKNTVRRREVASEQLRSPIFKGRASASRAHWRKTYCLATV